MPITQSAKKALRQNKRHRRRNVANAKRIKIAVKEFTKLIAAGKRDEAVKQLAAVYQAVDKVAKTKYISKNKAARIKSKLAKKLKK
jgi:small subunit ribosomal protein S20